MCILVNLTLYIHVLVCPRREVKRFVDLTADETSDLWIMAQKVGRQLEHHHKASSLTFAIQVRPLKSLISSLDFCLYIYIFFFSPFVTCILFFSSFCDLSRL